MSIHPDLERAFNIFLKAADKNAAGDRSIEYRDDLAVHLYGPTPVRRPYDVLSRASIRSHKVCQQYDLFVNDPSYEPQKFLGGRIHASVKGAPITDAQLVEDIETHDLFLTRGNLLVYLYPKGPSNLYYEITYHNNASRSPNASILRARRSDGLKTISPTFPRNINWVDTLTLYLYGEPRLSRATPVVGVPRR